MAKLEVPLVVFDDDGWLEVYDSMGDAVAHLEWPYLDEIVALYDGYGRPLRAWVEHEATRLDLAETVPALADLYGRVEEFYRAWTDKSPPDRVADASAYISSVRDHMREIRPRRRKREPRVEDLTCGPDTSG